MVNRVLEAKRIKLRRRNRYSPLSGGDSKVAFGKVSFSKQVINQGLRVGNNPARNLAVNPYKIEHPSRKDMVSDIPKTLGLSMELEQSRKLGIILRDKDKEALALHNRIIDGRQVKVFVFFDTRMTDIFLVEINYRTKTVRRSCNYPNIQLAQDHAICGKAVWLKTTVEIISSK